MSDPGLAAERTALAWGRTALGLIGVAALLLRLAGRGDVPAVGEVVAAGAVLAAGLVWWHGRSVYRMKPRTAAPLLALALAVTAVAAGATAAVTIELV